MFLSLLFSPIWTAAAPSTNEKDSFMRLQITHSLRNMHMFWSDLSEFIWLVSLWKWALKKKIYYQLCSPTAPFNVSRNKKHHTLFKLWQRVLPFQRFEIKLFKRILTITLPALIKAGLIWSLLCPPRKCWGFKLSTQSFWLSLLSKKQPSHDLQGSGKGRDGWILWPKTRLLVNWSCVSFIISFTSADELVGSNSICFCFCNKSELPARRKETEVSSFILICKGNCSLFPRVHLNASRNTPS